MKKKVALITGVTGQDGSYLSEFLIKKKYIVYGIKRRSSSFNTSRLDHLINNSNDNKNFRLVFGDLSDSSNLSSLINDIKPDEIYNLGAQSHVSVSFQIPEYTANINALGALRILEIIKNLKKKKKILNYTRHLLQNFLAIQENFHKMRIHHFILDHLMHAQNFLHIGLLLIIEKHTISLRAMESYLIMNRLDEEKLLLHAKLQWD
jgi:GDP-mannose 4,6-dehydratase